MKKRLACALLGVFFILPFVSAELSLQGPGVTQVNIGDELQVSGYLLQPTSLTGVFTLSLKCATSQTVATRFLSLQSNEQKPFTESFPVPVSVEGECVVEGIFTSGGSTLDTVATSPFTVTHTLAGGFNVQPSSLSLGEEMLILGRVTTISGEAVDGTATITLALGDVVAFVDTVKITNGVLSYTLTPESFQTGTYTILLDVRDGFGNSGLFSAGAVDIIGALQIVVKPSEESYDPGDVAKVSGTAVSMDKPLKSGTVFAQFDDRGVFYVKEGKVSGGLFSLRFDLADTISSGGHSILLTVEDESGNRGEVNSVFIVTPRPTVLTATLDASDILPGQPVNLRVAVLDQAGDLIEGDVAVEITDAEGDLFYAQPTASGTTTYLDVPTSAPPGTWKLRADGFGLDAKEMLTVPELLLVAYSIDGQHLTITNTGNVKYVGTLPLTLQNDVKQYTADKRVSLQIGASTTFDLGEGMTDGVYTVSVGDQAFEDVSLIGVPVSRLNWKWIILVGAIFFVCALLSFFSSRKKSIAQKKDSSRPPHQGLRPHDRPTHDINFTFHRDELAPSEGVVRRLAAHIKEKHNQRQEHKAAQQRLTEHKTYPQHGSYFDDLSRPKIDFKVTQRDGDMYAFGLPKKEKRDPSTYGEGWFTGQRDRALSKPASSHDYEVDEFGRYKKKEDAPKRGGMFSMFD